MTPEQKARDLIEWFSPHASHNNEYGSQENKAHEKHSRQCAIICVAEIIKALTAVDDELEDLEGVRMGPHLFWQEVLEHLKKQ